MNSISPGAPRLDLCSQPGNVSCLDEDCSVRKYFFLQIEFAGHRLNLLAIQAKRLQIALWRLAFGVEPIVQRVTTDSAIRLPTCGYAGKGHNVPGEIKARSWIAKIDIQSVDKGTRFSDDAEQPVAAG
jgi:hypothetical protein